ncbi:MAG: tripartite tricarboxylate transporter TctB family protein [Candidatus Ventricola sp.]
MGEIIFMLIAMAVCVLGFAESFTWRVIADDNSGGAAFWPRIIMAALFVCCLIRIFQILRDKEQLRKKFVFLDAFYGHRGIFLLSMVLYAVAINYLGFMIGTILFLNVMVNLMHYFTKGTLGAAKWIVVRTICLTAVAIGVNYFFSSILRIMVPTGIFGI